MAIWTPEQDTALAGMGKILFSNMGTLLHIVHDLTFQVVALRLLLAQKGLATDEEVEAAIREFKVNAAMALEDSPEIKELEEQWNRLVAGTENEG